MTVACDLHNHSCLSPCGSLDLSPAALARLGRERGLGLVALTDHNSALNCVAFAECARREGIAALYGMEACSAEEAHVLCLFASPLEALSFGEVLYGGLPEMPYEPDSLGDQAWVDADELIEGEVGRYLGAALDIGFDDLCRMASGAGALVIPAHIDRPMFGVLSQLGFLPDGPYSAVEVLGPEGVAAAKGYTPITGSDAHYPEHVARRPFGLELGAGWIDAAGKVDLDAIRGSLARGSVRLPGGTFGPRGAS